jgi:hypothetical protein
MTERSIVLPFVPDAQTLAQILTARFFNSTPLRPRA